jgi:hypothetical protein
MIFLWVFRLGFGFHLRLLKSPMNYFIMNLHVGIAYKLGFHSKVPKLHIGYFKMTLHMGIVLKGGSLSKVN